MPLEHSSSKKAFNTNVRTLMHDVGKSPHVKSRAQALAIAYSTKREAEGRAMGGVAPMMAQAFNPVANGVAPGTAMPPQSMGAGLNGMLAGPAGAKPLKKGGVAIGTSKPVGMTTGPLVSAVPGRTDLHFTHVPSGSYVIPADIVSAHGQGNTLAGMHALHKKFNLHQEAVPKSAYPAKAKKFAHGGADKHVGKPVPVKLAGGEIVIPPGNVHEYWKKRHGNITLDEAHKHMDKWVVDERKKLRKTLAKLPGPVRE